MTAKFILAFCASALFAQVYSQYLGCAGLRSSLAYDAPCGCGAGLRKFGYETPCKYAADIAAASSLKAACGGALGVISSSAVPLTGLNVASENLYEGSVAVAGNLPFLGTVEMEGAFPTVGAGAVSYGCGDGCVGITAEGVAPAAIVAPAAGLASPFDLSYKGYAGRIGGCGCDSIY